MERYMKLSGYATLDEIFARQKVQISLSPTYLKTSKDLNFSLPFVIAFLFIPFFGVLPFFATGHWIRPVPKTPKSVSL